MNIETLTSLSKKHAKALVGSANAARIRSIRVQLLQSGTRTLYLATFHLPGAEATVVIKHRCSSAETESRQCALEETQSEFERLQKVSQAVGTDAPAWFHVPRPLLALPTSGLLFMDFCKGVRLDRLLRRMMMKLKPEQEALSIARRSGEWLRFFRGLSADSFGFDCKAHLPQQRTANYIYQLLGLHGRELRETMCSNVGQKLTRYGLPSEFHDRINATLSKCLSAPALENAKTGPAHGKYSARDILLGDSSVAVVDFEHTSTGVAYLDPAFLLYQFYMVARWRPFGLGRHLAQRMRAEFLAGYEYALDPGVVDAFIAYYMVNSLRKEPGIKGRTSRRCAYHWLSEWMGRSI